jgi:hypothetical protein
MKYTPMILYIKLYVADHRNSRQVLYHILRKIKDFGRELVPFAGQATHSWEYPL